MSRATYVIRDGALVEKHLATPLHDASDAPNVIRDGMDTLRNMADGRFYDSKRAFSRATRAAGCVEIGTEKLTIKAPPKPPRPGPYIKQAIEQLRAR